MREYDSHLASFFKAVGTALTTVIHKVLIFLSVEILILPPPGEDGLVCQTRLTKTTRCPHLPYAGGVGFAHAFTSSPAGLDPAMGSFPSHQCSGVYSHTPYRGLYLSRRLTAPSQPPAGFYRQFTSRTTSDEQPRKRSEPLPLLRMA